MTNTRAINAAAGVIHACIQQGKPLPVSIAFALESAGLLNSPEHAAEVTQLHTDLDGARLSLWEEEQDSQRARFAAKVARQRAAKLRARVAELEAEAEAESCRCPEPAPLCGGCRCQCHTGDGSTRTADEDPIAFSLTPEALHAASGAVIEIPAPHCTCARAWNLHSRDCALYTPGHELAATREDPHTDPVGLHHDYRTPHDLPEVTS